MKKKGAKIKQIPYCAYKGRSGSWRNLSK